MEFLQIIVDNIFPLLTFMLIGYILDVKYRVNVAALSKLTVFVVLPCFIFYSIYVAELDMDMFFVFLLSCMQMALIGILAWAVGKARGFSPEKIEAFKNGTMFSNNGNIGIALIALVFTHAPYIVDGKAPYLAEAGDDAGADEYDTPHRGAVSGRERGAETPGGSGCGFPSAHPVHALCGFSCQMVRI